MPRYKLIIEYDGQPFSGWQRQQDVLSVQEVIEDALYRFLKVKTQLFGSGRTDAGVHALGQVAHVDTEKNYPVDGIRGALNYQLKGHSISIISVEQVDEIFHARFSATLRSYRYIILNRISAPALEKDRVWWVPRPLDAEIMNKAAQYLVGHYDFSSFRDSQCQSKSPMKTLSKLQIFREGTYIYIDVCSKSFLHRQVRNIVGTLKRIGDGSWPPEKMIEILEAKDRKVAGPTAPAQGLYLTEICFSKT